ncbi:hypothetical protein KC345_g156 [Hortaea werneckii]|nr:hypothetical protein KC345_g156 [Hortaea werneckii]
MIDCAFCTHSAPVVKAATISQLSVMADVSIAASASFSQTSALKSRDSMKPLTTPTENASSTSVTEVQICLLLIELVGLVLPGCKRPWQVIESRKGIYELREARAHDAGLCHTCPLYLSRLRPVSALGSRNGFKSAYSAYRKATASTLALGGLISRIVGSQQGMQPLTRQFACHDHPRPVRVECTSRGKQVMGCLIRGKDDCRLPGQVHVHDRTILATHAVELQPLKTLGHLQGIANDWQALGCIGMQWCHGDGLFMRRLLWGGVTLAMVHWRVAVVSGHREQHAIKYMFLNGVISKSCSNQRENERLLCLDPLAWTARDCFAKQDEDVIFKCCLDFGGDFKIRN